MELDYILSSCTKMNSKWIKDLNIRPKTVRYTEENIGTKLRDLGHREHFIDLTPKAKEAKAKRNEWNFHFLIQSSQKTLRYRNL